MSRTCPVYTNILLQFFLKWTETNSVLICCFLQNNPTSIVQTMPLQHRATQDWDSQLFTAKNPMLSMTLSHSPSHSTLHVNLLSLLFYSTLALYRSSVAAARKVLFRWCKWISSPIIFFTVESVMLFDFEAIQWTNGDVKTIPNYQNFLLQLLATQVRVMGAWMNRTQIVCN